MPEQLMLEVTYWPTTFMLRDAMTQETMCKKHFEYYDEEITKYLGDKGDYDFELIIPTKEQILELHEKELNKRKAKKEMADIRKKYGVKD